MADLIVTRGLPASGKSTWSKSWVAVDPENRVRVNRDDLRHMMFNAYWGDGVNEDAVSVAEEAIVRAALKAGKSVVIDATHMRAAYIKKWAKIQPVTIKEFTAPVSVLEIRDQERIKAGHRGVGPGVISGLAKRFHVKDDGTLPAIDLSEIQSPVFKPYVPGAVPAYCWDIDGTLARMVERGPYDTSKYHTDVADRNLSELFWHIQDGARYAAEKYTWDDSLDRSVATLVLSGRSEEFKPVLIEWLNGWGLEVDPDLIFMRAEGDMRNDAIVKSELVDKHISGVYDVIMHFDDRNRVVDALRAKGMKVAQVEYGDF